MTYNKVFLMGNLCADVEIRQVGSGAVAQLRLAVNEGFTNPNLRAEGRRKIVREICTFADGNCTQRVVDKLRILI